ncbi:MAG: GntR family transcriptional regulator, partial [Pseudomonadales bacterium]
AAQIMNGSFQEGESISSVRHVAAELQINHLTVAKAYQELVDEGVLEMKRGRGMFVVEGASDKLRSQERKKFIAEELPTLLARLTHLDISIDELISLIRVKEK